MRILAFPPIIASVLLLGAGCGLLGTSTPPPTNTPPRGAALKPVPTPDIEATAQAAIQAEVPTPTLTPTPVPIVHLSYEEALSGLTAYLLEEISLISLADTRNEAEVKVRDWVVRGFRRGNTWFLAGPGLVRDAAGQARWTEGQWALSEEDLTLSPVDVPASTLFASLDTWAQAIPTPTPAASPTSTIAASSPPTPSPLPSATASPGPTSSSPLRPAPTPTPTTSPTSSSTPVPTATPTSTPVPTAAPTSTPVLTAAPTSTPVPTVTPWPTIVPTAEPTSTPVPTATPTFTPVPTPAPLSTPENFVPDLKVTKTEDTGDGQCDSDCSLREAIETADADDLIEVPPGIYTLDSEIEIGRSLTLIGSGATWSIVQASSDPGVADFRIFRINNGNVRFIGLGIRNGHTDSVGGGIWNLGGFLTLETSTVSHNIGGDGGGIMNNGTLILIDSTVSHNTATNVVGGGIYNVGELILERATVSDNEARRGGGIYTGGSGSALTRTMLANSTVSGNRARSHGGGIFSKPPTELTLVNVTIANNVAAGFEYGGGGIYSEVQVFMSNTILAGNTAIDGPDCAGNAITSGGFNLLGNGSGCEFSSAFRDLTGNSENPIEPKMGPLQANGGPTKTHALLAGSPAIDAGNSGLSTDQRGTIRPQGSGTDIGAFER